MTIEAIRFFFVFRNQFRINLLFEICRKIRMNSCSKVFHWYYNILNL
ncbi:hypothetical protein LEP1GSC042_1212 [Leptospira kirschneri serovar Bim str. PUO 1247]|nr:hypothetical protein LEP1GSC042_1212 [Leptospira kirschneri serovar Bim str. PUO 1247]